MTPSARPRAAIYARVSTLDQEPENQLAELRRYVAARGWTAVEFVDRGVSGSRDRRPALDAVLTAIKRRQFDVLVCWRLDRLGRSLKHLVTLLDELQALGGWHSCRCRRASMRRRRRVSCRCTSWPRSLSLKGHGSPSG